MKIFFLLPLALILVIPAHAEQIIYSEGKEYDTISGITATEFETIQTKDHPPIFDVRKESEFLSEHIQGATHTPLDFLNDHLGDFPSEGQFYIHCAGGYRSVIAASILKKRGVHNLIDIKGGFKAIKETPIQLTDLVCPSTL